MHYLRSFELNTQRGICPVFGPLEGAVEGRNGVRCPNRQIEAAMPPWGSSSTAEFGRKRIGAAGSTGLPSRFDMAWATRSRAESMSWSGSRSCGCATRPLPRSSSQAVTVPACHPRDWGQLHGRREFAFVHHVLDRAP